MYFFLTMPRNHSCPMNRARIWYTVDVLLYDLGYWPHTFFYFKWGWVRTDHLQFSQTHEYHVYIAFTGDIN